MAKNLNLLPTSIIAGETISATIAAAVTPNAIKVVYQFSASTPFEVECAKLPDGAGWKLDVSSAKTLTLRRGSVRYVGMMTGVDNATACFDSGTISVDPSPMMVSKFRPMLDAVNQAISDYASNPNKRITVDTITIEYRSLDELIGLQGFLQSQVADETGEGFGGGPRRIRGGFR